MWRRKEKRFDLSDGFRFDHVGGSLKYGDVEVIKNFVQVRAKHKLSWVEVDSDITGDMPMLFSGILTNCHAKVDTAGVTGNTKVDIRLDGVSVLSAPLNISSGQELSDYGIISSNIFNKGGNVTFAVTEVSSTKPYGLTINLEFIRTLS